MAVSVPCLLFAVPWVGLRSVIVALSGYTYLLEDDSKEQ